MPSSSLSMAGTSEQLTGQPSSASSQDRPERSRNGASVAVRWMENFVMGAHTSLLIS